MPFIIITHRHSICCPPRQQQGPGLTHFVFFSPLQTRKRPSISKIIDLKCLPVLLSKKKVNLSQDEENPIFKSSTCS